MPWRHRSQCPLLVYGLLGCALLTTKVYGGSGDPPGSRRALSEELFLSYEPLTTVTDDAAIDLDQHALDVQMSLGTDQSREAAYKIYTQGAFSKSYALLSLQSPLPISLAKGTTLLGHTTNGKEVLGQLLEETPPGSTTLKFRYHPSPIQDTWTNCHVGGNPTPNTEGCLVGLGQIEIDELGSFDYEYEILEDNYNARTIQSFSTKAKEKMYDCNEGCPYSVYKKFYNYYGVHDYADQWVQAAFQRTSTNFTRGNAQFGGTYKTDLGYRQAITLGTVYLNTWMYIIREMDHSSAMCSAKGPCNNHLDIFSGTEDEYHGPPLVAGQECNNDDMMHAWDKAVAFYVGSKAKTAGQGGHLLFSMAQERCLNFGTCGPSQHYGLMARVNFEMMQSFRQGQEALKMRACSSLKRHVRLLTAYMTVPLVQGVILYARENELLLAKSNREKQEQSQATGATYAAALLPLLHACNKEDANIVYESMRVGRGVTPHFSKVKAALERNYYCLGITCELVGGIVDPAGVNGKYLLGAEPCKDPSHHSPLDLFFRDNQSGNTGPNIALVICFSVVLVVLMILFSVFIGRSHACATDKEFDGPASSATKFQDGNGELMEEESPVSLEMA
ncbi:expressed unknown protein [Seminavis robusta]|uniref:Uncharacterized protein n=1 Tax=Seminavis robusta TaxID=568900 RepID=A0A9N8E5K6_9STRA|nr:expressed unknown protein [Seminavis robusta]|eukprot:Sro643_g180280.1 n/a (616) ;mRNA; f:19501-21513